MTAKLPAFLTSLKCYRSSQYRFLTRLASGPLAHGPFVAGVESASASFTENSTPTENEQFAIVKQDTPKNITLTGSDPDGDPLVFEIARPPEHGRLSGQPPNVTYTPDRGFLGKDAFTFRVTDGESYSAPANVTLDVVARGEPPVLQMSAGCTDYREQAPAVEVDRELRLFDPDDTVLDSARVRIAPELQGGDDLLFTDQKGISGSYDDSTGTLTLTGDAPVATYDAGLHSVL